MKSQRKSKAKRHEILTALIVATAVWHAGAARAVTLLSDLGQVYSESLNAESFPTTPEIDWLGLGGMVPYQSGSPLPPAPTFTGTHMAISVVESPGAGGLQGSGGLVAIDHPTEPIGLFARFDSFGLIRDTTNGSFQTAVVVLRDSSLNNGAAAYLLDFQNGLLRIVVSSLGAILTGYSQVFLTPTADAAIRAGTPFEIELHFDAATDRAQAALTVGSEYFETAETTGTVFANMNAIDEAVVLNSSTNNAAPVAQVSSQLDQFEIYLPEPNGMAAVFAGIVWLAGMSRERRDTRRITRGVDRSRGSDLLVETY